MHEYPFKFLTKMKPINPAKIKIIEEHNEAFLLWKDRLLNIKGVTLYHIDSHSDMDIPILSGSIYKPHYPIQKQLTIDTFITPAILLGLIKNVVYINPRGIEKKTSVRSIGSVGGKGVVLKLDVKNKGIFPDLKKWRYQVTSKVNLNKGTGILDIDLDYFSCNLFIHPQLQLPINHEQFLYLKRFNQSQNNNDREIGLYNLTNSYLAFKQNDADLIYNDSELTIDYAIENFIYELNIKPTLISICRSVRTGYTPTKWGSYIEHKLVSCLSNPPAHKPKYIFEKIELYPFIGFYKNTIFNPITNKFIKVSSNINKFIWDKIQTEPIFSQVVLSVQKTFKHSKNESMNKTYKFLMFLKEQMVIR